MMARATNNQVSVHPLVMDILNPCRPSLRSSSSRRKHHLLRGVGLLACLICPALRLLWRASTMRRPPPSGVHRHPYVKHRRAPCAVRDGRLYALKSCPAPVQQRRRRRSSGRQLTHPLMLHHHPRACRTVPCLRCRRFRVLHPSHSRASPSLLPRQWPQSHLLRGLRTIRRIPRVPSSPCRPSRSHPRLSSLNLRPVRSLSVVR